MVATSSLEKAPSPSAVARFNQCTCNAAARNGTLTISVYPNTLDTPFSHTLLPNLGLPSSMNGDTELPVNECGSRLFLSFLANAVGSNFTLSRIVMVMHQDPWSPVRGVNN